LLTVVALWLGLSAASAVAQTSLDTAVEVSAVAQKSPPRITLSWPAKAGASSVVVYRKTYAATVWGSPLATLAGGATGYADSSVTVGTTYEYWVYAQNSVGANGYIAAGIEAPLSESRGKVVLIVDSTYAADLSAELSRLEQDLAGDGWIVLRHDVARTETVPNVKAWIQRDYARDPSNVTAVFLFGHVPVPYSGATAPDGHAGHYGAWPADLYYGDMDGVWTDVQNYDSTVAGRQHNVAGDGKFDQNLAPSAIELEVGRVDLSNMPAFAPKTELDLLRQYLNKDHNFRHKVITAQPRGLIDDNFGYFGGEAFASSGWRSFSAFFGAANVSALDWFTTLATQSYLWAYGCGGGSFTGAGGVGSTSNFASTDTQVVFTMLFGSYFGDWDSANNFLRAPLATTTYGLTDAWSGRPVWYFHHMAMGETVGYSARVTQNNNGTYWGTWGPAIHIALMGDPTLRMHVVAPPSALTATPSGGQVTLQWTASSDPVLGYNVYRSASPAGPFVRLNGGLIAGTSFVDSAVGSDPAGAYTYMVRAVRLETSASGSYDNASQGIFQDAAAGSGPSSADLAVTADAAPATAVIGALVSLFVSVSNNGPADATGVALTQTIPAGLAFVSAPAGCAFSAGAVTCAVGALARGARADYAIVVSGASAGSHASTSSVSSALPDPAAGNNNAPSSVTIIGSAATSTVLSSSLNPSTLGQAVTFTATVASPVGGTPTGTVTFRDGTVSLGSAPLDAAGQATVTISALTLGAHSITANYGGDSHFGASASPTITQTVKVNSSTALSSSRNPSIFKQAVTWTATVTSSSGTPTGTVSFLDSGTSIGFATLNSAGQASITLASLAVGTHSLTASYAGDVSHNPSNSAALSQVVQAATGAATSTAVVSSLNPAAVGQNVTFTATVTSGTAGTPTGTVSFLFSSTLLGTATLGAGAKASVTVSFPTPGFKGITAVYNGDATFAPSTSSPLIQTIRDTSSVALTSSANPSGVGQNVVFTATVTDTNLTSTPTGTVTFFDGGTALGTSSVFYPGRATFSTSALAKGSHSITAAYSGDTLSMPSTSPIFVQIVGTGMGFYTLTPCRLIDTRGAAGPLGGPALSAGSERTFTVTGHCGLPSSARAISVNVTVTAPGAAGDFRLFAGGTPLPVSSTINYRSGQTRANNAFVALGSGGTVTVRCDQPGGTAQLILDVNGYYQ